MLILLLQLLLRLQLCQHKVLAILFRPLCLLLRPHHVPALLVELAIVFRLLMLRQQLLRIFATLLRICCQLALLLPALSTLWPLLLLLLSTLWPLWPLWPLSTLWPPALSTLTLWSLWPLSARRSYSPSSCL